jgi:ribosomal protein L24
MKLTMKVGDKVKVLKGKLVGKEANVVAIDKKNYRVKLAGLKVSKQKSKSGKSVDLHGSFHVTSLVSLNKPAAEVPTETAAPAEAKAS